MAGRRRFRQAAGPGGIRTQRYPEFAPGDRGETTDRLEARREANSDWLDACDQVDARIDPDDDYPRNYAGCIRAVLNDGSVVEERQPHLRGGAREPLERDALIRKCAANLDYAGADPSLAAATAEWADGLERNTEAVRAPWA